MGKPKRSNRLRSLFKKYYDTEFNIDNIWRMEGREFAFQPFEEDTMIRHLAFSTTEALAEYVKKLVPRHAYYSTAVYEYPDNPQMDEKVWEGAELVFDIDADHIDTGCKKEHDLWTCTSCGASGSGHIPSACPNCGSTKISEFTWVCPKCIEEAKLHTIRLVEDFLIPDLGVPPSKINVYFTGHRGFHIHVLDEEFIRLDGDARREIVNYVKGLGIDFRAMSVTYRKTAVPILTLNDPGWRGRLARAVYDLLASLSPHEILARVGYFEGVEEALKNRDKLLDLLAGDYEDVFEGIKMLGARAYLRLLWSVAESLGVEVDEKVTIDVKRLIRMPNTLHGKTGLKVVEVKRDRVDSFELSEDLSPFRGTARIKLLRDVPIKLEIFSDKVYGVRGDRLKVTLSTGVYLAAKGIGEIEEVLR